MFLLGQRALTVSLHHTDLYLVPTPALKSMDLVVVTTHLLLIQYPTVTYTFQGSLHPYASYFHEFESTICPYEHTFFGGRGG